MFLVNLHGHLDKRTQLPTHPLSTLPIPLPNTDIRRRESFSLGLSVFRAPAPRLALFIHRYYCSVSNNIYGLSAGYMYTNNRLSVPVDHWHKYNPACNTMWGKLSSYSRCPQDPRHSRTVRLSKLPIGVSARARIQQIMYRVCLDINLIVSCTLCR